MTDIKNLKECMDGWVKSLRREYTEMAFLPGIVIEHSETIQHNYELIYDLREQIDILKQEVNALKLIQIIALKAKEEQNGNRICECKRSH